MTRGGLTTKEDTKATVGIVDASLLAGWPYIAFQTWFPPFGRFSTTRGKSFWKGMGVQGEGNNLFAEKGFPFPLQKKLVS